MTKRSAWSMVAGVVVVSVALLSACGETDPAKPEYWIARLDDAKEGEEAARKLGELRDPKGTAPLIKVLETNPKLKPLAAQSLGMIGDAQAIPALIAALDPEAGAGSDEVTRTKQRANERALIALGELKAKAASEQVLKFYVRARDPNVRQAAIRAMGQIGDPKFVPVLSDIVEQDENMFLKRIAAEGLGDIGDPAGVDALVWGMYYEKGASIYPACSFALYQIGAPAIPALLATLQGKNAKVNKLAEERGFVEGAVAVKAIEVLGDLRAKSAEDAILKQWDAVKNEVTRPIVRRSVAMALAQLGGGRAVALLGKNAAEPAADMRQIIVDALNELSDRAALPALLAAAKTGDDEAKRIAFQAFTRLGDSREFAAASALAKGNEAFGKELVRLQAAKECGENFDCWLGKLRDKDPKVRERAALALGRLGDKKAGEALAAAVKDDNLEARYAIVWALHRAGSPGQVAALEKVYAAEKGQLYYVRVNEYLRRLIVNLKRA